LKFYSLIHYNTVYYPGQLPRYLGIFTGVVAGVIYQSKSNSRF